MSDIEFPFGWLSDPRLAAHALSPMPVWLWSADAPRLLWANPTGAAIFDAPSPAAVSGIAFEPRHPAAQQVMRLAGTLPQGGAPRLERLRGFGAALGGALICMCSRIVLADNSSGILVVATERAGKDLALPERAHRVLADFDAPAAIFTADGEPIDSLPAARERFGAHRDLVALGAAPIAREATLNGKAEGETAAGSVAMLKLEAGATVALLLVCTGPAKSEPVTEPSAEPAAIEAAPVIANPVAAEPPAIEAPAAIESSSAAEPEPQETRAESTSPIAAEAEPKEASPQIANPVVTEPARVHRLPFRFVWQMDAENRFTQGAQDFAKIVGPQAAQVLERTWPEIADTLKLDPEARVVRALATHSTWSGIVVHWPADDGGERIAVEMSALPVFDPDRQFAGFRGFGICRDVERLEALQRRRAEAPPPPPAPAPPEAVKAKADEPDNVLPFPLPPPPEPRAEGAPSAATATIPTLSPREHSAFQELARELNERLRQTPIKAAEPAPELACEPAGEPASEIAVAPADTAQPETAAEPSSETPAEFIAAPVAPPPEPPKPVRHDEVARDAREVRPILDRLPLGILVYRLNNLVYANRAFLDWTGYPTLEALAEAGGLDSLFIETKDTPEDAASAIKNGAKTLSIATVDGDRKPVDGLLFSTAWNDENALVLMISPQNADDEARRQAAEAERQRLEQENRTLAAVLDTATDGVLVVDRTGRVLSANRSAEALFGYDDFREISLGDLFAPESRRAVLDYLDRLAHAGGTRMLDAGREAIGRVKKGGLVPLFITMGRIEEGAKFCAVLRDITAWKRTEEELINARQDAEKASTAKSEFLAKISHEIRTPLNAIIGFSEVMMDERFGPVGNDRYRQYLRDIHTSGGHLISLLDDLLDLSKIEAGKLDLTFVSVDLNALVQQCVALMQEQANRERVIIRTSLPANLPPIVADARSVRQIALNLLSNSIKFTGAGGQVIVSTALNDDNEVILRVRDTGIGMSEKELQTALEPFRQIATAARKGASGTGLGLPITKALAEANHARFRITSRVAEGTLVEVAFPATRILTR